MFLAIRPVEAHLGDTVPRWRCSRESSLASTAPNGDSRRSAKRSPSHRPKDRPSTPSPRSTRARPTAPASTPPTGSTKASKNDGAEPRGLDPRRTTQLNGARRERRTPARPAARARRNRRNAACARRPAQQPLSRDRHGRHRDRALARRHLLGADRPPQAGRSWKPASLVLGLDGSASALAAVRRRTSSRHDSAQPSRSSPRLATIRPGQRAPGQTRSIPGIPSIRSLHSSNAPEKQTSSSSARAASTVSAHSGASANGSPIRPGAPSSSCTRPPPQTHLRATPENLRPRVVTRWCRALGQGGVLCRATGLFKPNLNAGHDVEDTFWGLGFACLSEGVSRAEATRKAICWPFVKLSDGLEPSTPS